MSGFEKVAAVELQNGCTLVHTSGSLDYCVMLTSSNGYILLVERNTEPISEFNLGPLATVAINAMKDIAPIQNWLVHNPANGETMELCESMVAHIIAATTWGFYNE